MPALIKHYIGGDNELKKNTELWSSESVSRPIIHRNLTMKTFLKQADINDMTLSWQKYKKEIERQFRFFGITDPETKRDGLLIYGRQDLVDVDDALPAMFQNSNYIHSYNLRGSNSSLFLPRPNTEYGRKCFRYSGVKIWNSIPEQVRNSESLNSFHRNISSVSLTN